MSIPTTEGGRRKFLVTLNYPTMAETAQICGLSVVDEQTVASLIVSAGAPVHLDDTTCLDGDDGWPASDVLSIREITDAEAQVLDALGLSQFGSAAEAVELVIENPQTYPRHSGYTGKPIPLQIKEPIWTAHQKTN